MIPGAVFRSPGIYFTAEENPRNLRYETIEEGCVISHCRLKWVPIPPNEVGRIAQHVRNKEGRNISWGKMYFILIHFNRWEVINFIIFATCFIVIIFWICPGCLSWFWISAYGHINISANHKTNVGILGRCILLTLNHQSPRLFFKYSFSLRSCITLQYTDPVIRLFKGLFFWIHGKGIGLRL